MAGQWLNRSVNSISWWKMDDGPLLYCTLIISDKTAAPTDTDVLQWWKLVTLSLADLPL